MMEKRYIPDLFPRFSAKIMKYTRPDKSSIVGEVITAYEEATASIEARESALEDCRSFEVTASNPLRLFKGRGCERIDEENIRKEHMINIMIATKRCQEVCMNLYRLYNEKVQYQGVLYTTKMCRDYIRMISSLEAERRENSTSCGPQGELEIGL
jgi:hypothetical protein